MASEKQVVFAELARIGMALGSPKRLELIHLLCQVERNVEELADAIGASVAATSHHLQILKRARLASTKKVGQRVYYRLNRKVPELWVALSAAGDENLAEIRSVMAAFLADSGSFTQVGARELMRQVRAGEVLLLDVRPAAEYEAGHFPGAVSVPADELKARLKSLPKDKEVIAYCRGPYCLLSHGVVERLREKGFRAKRWLQGVPDWITGGVRLEHTPLPPARRPTAPSGSSRRTRTSRVPTRASDLSR